MNWGAVKREEKDKWRIGMRGDKSACAPVRDATRQSLVPMMGGRNTNLRSSGISGLLRVAKINGADALHFKHQVDGG
jgi:hypothetical protein